MSEIISETKRAYMHANSRTMAEFETKLIIIMI